MEFQTFLDAVEAFVDPVDAAADRGGLFFEVSDPAAQLGDGGINPIHRATDVAQRFED
jgi:hypothetical protein